MRNVTPTIVLAHTPTQMEIYAGQELHKYLAKIFESSVEIIDEQFILAQEYLIYVGRTNKTLNFYSKCYAELTQDEFVIETKKEEAFLFGKENEYSQAATLYAVYDFLEKAYGVKFYSYDEELIPKTKFCGFPILSIREKPDFLMRQPLYASTRRYPTFRVADFELRGMHSHGKTADACIEVIANNRTLTLFIELSILVKGKGICGDYCTFVKLLKGFFVSSH